MGCLFFEVSGNAFGKSEVVKRARWRLVTVGVPHSMQMGLTAIDDGSSTTRPSGNPLDPVCVSFARRGGPQTGPRLPNKAPSSCAAPRRRFFVTARHDRTKLEAHKLPPQTGTKPPLSFLSAQRMNSFSAGLSRLAAHSSACASRSACTIERGDSPQ
jgi:hypothetical protein